MAEDARRFLHASDCATTRLPTQPLSVTISYILRSSKLPEDRDHREIVRR